MSDVLHRFRKPFLRYIEFVGPVLNFMGLKKADSTAILRIPSGEIIWHAFSPLEATRWRVGKFPLLPFVAPDPIPPAFRLIATTFSLGFTSLSGRAQLNIENIFNKGYWASAGGRDNISPGQPRTFRFESPRSCAEAGRAWLTSPYLVKPEIPATRNDASTKPAILCA